MRRRRGAMSLSFAVAVAAIVGCQQAGDQQPAANPPAGQVAEGQRPPDPLTSCWDTFERPVPGHTGDGYRPNNQRGPNGCTGQVNMGQSPDNTPQAGDPRFGVRKTVPCGGPGPNCVVRLRIDFATRSGGNNQPVADEEVWVTLSRPGGGSQRTRVTREYGTGVGADGLEISIPGCGAATLEVVINPGNQPGVQTEIVALQVVEQGCR
jgi:hypothetical protein